MMPLRLTLLLIAAPAAAAAAPVTYLVDPNHTHPLVEVDHFDGLSTWRGLFRKTSGSIIMDREAQTGTVDISIDVASIDFGQELLNRSVQGAKIGEFGGLDAAAYPVATYRGTLGDFVAEAPTTVNGTLTLHGVSRPLALEITSFKCLPQHPVLKREVCGADASGRFNRADFGIDAGRQFGFRQKVKLRIQVEAIRAEDPGPTP